MARTRHYTSWRQNQVIKIQGEAQLEIFNFSNEKNQSIIPPINPNVINENISVDEIDVEHIGVDIVIQLN